MNEPRVAVAGSGPSGLYTAAALLASGQPLHVDVIDGNVEIGRDLTHDELRRTAGEPHDEPFVLPAGLVVTAVGFRGAPLDGLPFSEAAGTVPNEGGRMVAGQAVVPGLYVAGWLKRGPSGIIGTNRPDGAETAAAVLADLAGRAVPARISSSCWPPGAARPVTGPGGCGRRSMRGRWAPPTAGEGSRSMTWSPCCGTVRFPCDK